MIPQTQLILPKQTWQKALSEAIRDPLELLSQLGLSGKLTAIDNELIKQFPLRVPQAYVDKMRYGDPRDPLLLQVFPLINEAYKQEGFNTDPVGDQLAISSPGVLQKYHGRALILATGACAIHCRYCFRRHFPYSDSNPLASQWLDTIKMLEADDSISEVILSGGDPLALTDDKLAVLVQHLECIPHIKRLRIHTRLPVVLPERVTDNLLTNLSDTRLTTVMVIHANHANELGNDVKEVLQKLAKRDVQLLNQSVLLKAVNDNVDALTALSERLLECGVLPYYLHLLDPVAGASHFDVNQTVGIGFIKQLRTLLPGYLVPRLVREQQGQPSKTVIC